MGGALDPGTPVAVECPGRTVFDVMIEAWPDQGSVRHLLDALHRLDLGRAARPAVLQLTTGPHSVWKVDPAKGTVAVTAGGRPVYPGLRDEDNTVVMPAIRTWQLP